MTVYDEKENSNDDNDNDDDDNENDDDDNEYDNNNDDDDDDDDDSSQKIAYKGNIKLKVHLIHDHIEYTLRVLNTYTLSLVSSSNTYLPLST